MKRTLRSDGYIYITVCGKLMLEHVHVVQLAIGRKLRGTETIHHVNGVRSDNSRSNLVLCPSAKYHHLLHIRARALERTGNPNLRQCKFCREYSDPSTMYLAPDSAFHRRCSNEYQNNRRRRGRHVNG